MNRHVAPKPRKPRRRPRLLNRHVRGVLWATTTTLAAVGAVSILLDTLPPLPEWQQALYAGLTAAIVAVASLAVVHPQEPHTPPQRSPQRPV